MGSSMNGQRVLASTATLPECPLAQGPFMNHSHSPLRSFVSRYCTRSYASRCLSARSSGSASSSKFATKTGPTLSADSYFLDRISRASRTRP